MKTFHAKKLARRRGRCSTASQPIMVQPNGRACLFLGFQHKLRVAARKVEIPDGFADTGAVDAQGVVYWQSVADIYDSHIFDVGLDGPAIKPDGTVVDIDGSRSIFFSVAEKGGVAQKEHARLVRAICMSHAACEAESHLETGEICSMDVDGVVQTGLLESNCTFHIAARLKRLHYKRLRRQRAPKLEVVPVDVVLCVSGGGRVLVHVPVDLKRSSRRQKELRELRALHRQHGWTPPAGTIPAIDGTGAMHW